MVKHSTAEHGSLMHGNLTAYEPIRDNSGKTIGILYVGVLEDPFLEQMKEQIERHHCWKNRLHLHNGYRRKPDNAS